jgi:hypothetical protein
MNAKELKKSGLELQKKVHQELRDLEEVALFEALSKIPHDIVSTLRHAVEARKLRDKTMGKIR